jgi:hypothetical protein
MFSVAFSNKGLVLLKVYRLLTKILFKERLRLLISA